MGFLDTVKQQFSKNKDKATEQYEKNKHKVAPLVDKATDQVDKVTKGKSASITAKVDEAAKKISGDSRRRPALRRFRPKHCRRRTPLLRTTTRSRVADAPRARPAPVDRTDASAGRSVLHHAEFEPGHVGEA